MCTESDRPPTHCTCHKQSADAKMQLTKCEVYVGGKAINRTTRTNYVRVRQIKTPKKRRTLTEQDLKSRPNEITPKTNKKRTTTTKKDKTKNNKTKKRQTNKKTNKIEQKNRRKTILEKQNKTNKPKTKAKTKNGPNQIRIRKPNQKTNQKTKTTPIPSTGGEREGERMGEGSGGSVRQCPLSRPLRPRKTKPLHM